MTPKYFTGGFAYICSICQWAANLIKAIPKYYFQQHFSTEYLSSGSWFIKEYCLWQTVVGQDFPSGGREFALYDNVEAPLKKYHEHKLY